MRKTCIYVIIAFHFLLSSASGQEKFADRIYPRSDSWSVRCKIYRLTENAVILMFPGYETPSEIMRTSIRKIEYENGRVVFLNKFGQIEAEIDLPMETVVEEVKNLGLLKLKNGEEVILNGIDFTLPADSLEQVSFHSGSDYVRRMTENIMVSLKFDRVRRDEFGRLRAYLILSDGKMLNMEIIRKGYCKVDRNHSVFYLEDLIMIENEAKRKKEGIWGIKK